MTEFRAPGRKEGLRARGAGGLGLAQLCLVEGVGLVVQLLHRRAAWEISWAGLAGLSGRMQMGQWSSYYGVRMSVFSDPYMVHRPTARRGVDNI